MICLLYYFLTVNLFQLTQADRHYTVPDSKNVTSSPKVSITVTYEPSPIPSLSLSASPSILSSTAPSGTSTSVPTSLPSKSPSQLPSWQPSHLPYQIPSPSPTQLPSPNPSPSYSPSTPPSSSSNEYYNGCKKISSHLIGQQTPRTVTVPYMYQMEYRIDFQFQLDQIVESLENDININLVEAFIHCDNNNSTRKSSRNLFSMEESVVGISSRPKDVDTGTCDPDEEVRDIKCMVFIGGLTLFYDDKTKRHLGPSMEDDIVKDIKSMIQEMMENDTLIDAHIAIVSLKFIEATKLEVPSDNGAGDDDDNLILDRTPISSNSYAWLIFTTGSIFLTGVVGIFRYQCRKQEEMPSSVEDYDESSSTGNNVMVEEDILEEDEKQSSYSLNDIFPIAYERMKSKNHMMYYSITEEDAETLGFNNQA